MTNEVVLDTSALIEYTNGTNKGKIIRNIIEKEENLIIIPSIVLGEFISKLERKGIKTHLIIENLSAYTISTPLETHHCINAGKLHATLRKKEKGISLIDCIIMEIGKECGNALILTTDKHFKHYKNSRIF